MNGWPVLPLIEVLSTLENGTRPPGGVAAFSSGVPSIGGEHLYSNGSFNFENLKYIPEEFYEKMKRGHIQEEDVLVVKDGATTGKTAFVSDSFPYKRAAVNEHVYILRTDQSKLLPRLLFYFLISKIGQQQILSSFTGTAIGGINQTFARATRIPVPPLPDQHRIVRILDEADNLRKLRQEADKKTAELIPAIFYEMFGDPGRNEKGWEVKFLAEVTTINPKIAKNELPKPDTEVTFVPMASVNQDLGIIESPEVRHYSEVAKGYTPFQTGDVLFAKITPCMQNGKIAIATNLPTKFGFGSTEFHVIRPSKFVTSEYLLWLVRRADFRRLAEQNFTGTAGQQRVPVDFLKKYRFPVPPLNLQHEFAKRVAEVRAMEEKQAESRKKLDELFNSLLDRAFKGEL